MGMILSLTTLVFLLMVQMACYHAISAPVIGTSSEVILKSGAEGTLQCGFKGKAKSVYWTHHGSSSKQVLLIKLDMLQPTGHRRVSGYGEGRYNITNNFSLIIHNVTEEDEGRYACEVLESITCSLLRNYTFVSVAGMHSEVMLKSGENGTLTCDIKGEAHVVYWTYQDASSKPVLLVRLELFQHQVGQRRVVLYAEERYNITDDFSLIIHEVTLADEGRYTCEILELTGSIMRKHSDVSVPEVKTVPNVLLESGKRAKLTCDYKRNVYAVYWRYESTTSPNMELLVVMDGYYQVGERRGPGYDDGRFDITDDYSLVIHNVEAHNEGRYTCEVSDFKTRLVLRNHTDVHTIVIAERPFVRIEQCEDEVSADDINAPCAFRATSDVPSTELTCTVLGAKPLVELTWISKSHNMSEYWKQVMDGSAFTEKARGDGIFDQTLTVYVDTSFFTSVIQHFTCVAEGLAVDGKASLTIAVYFSQVSNVTWTVVAVVISVACTLLFFLVIIFVWWKVRDKRPSQKGPMTNIFDGTIINLAEALGNHNQLSSLGEKLGFKQAMMSHFIRSNRLNEDSSGTRHMLFAFRDRTRQVDLIPRLVHALEESDLEEFAKCIEGTMTNISDGTIINLAEAIGNHYQLSSLGNNFGFKQAMMSHFIQSNRLNEDSSGTRDMLFAFRDKTRQVDLIPRLVHALEESDLEEFAKYIEGSMLRIQKKRFEILQEITQNNPHRKSLYFGVFGDREAGKSALIDSLICALIGGNHKEIPEELANDRGTVWRMTTKRPSKLIALCEIRDMEDVNLNKLKQLLEPITADDGNMRTDDAIHYPIIVYDIGKHRREGSYEESLTKFCEAVKRFISQNPILVLKRITQSDIPDLESFIDRLSSKTSVPVDNIFFIGNKKVDDITKEDEILQLLDILLKCVKNVTGDNAQRQTDYRKKRSKRAKRSWQQASEKVPSKQWYKMIGQASEQSNDPEELSKLNKGDTKV